MARKKVKPFDDRNTAEAISLYKAGVSIAEMKKKWSCYGNPIVARLKKAGVYKAGRRAPVTAKRQPRELPIPITNKQMVDNLAKAVVAKAAKIVAASPRMKTAAAGR